jgi:rubredoxin
MTTMSRMIAPRCAAQDRSFLRLNGRKTGTFITTDDPCRRGMTRYRCNVCNMYTYDSEKGDPGTGIPAGTQPEDFPDTWKCPFCGSAKVHLQPEKEYI